MKTLATSPDVTLSVASRTLAIMCGLMLLQGFVQADSIEQFLAYLFVVLAAVLPSILWIKRGAPEIPVLPAVALAYIPYFAWPVLGRAESTLNYTLDEILSAAFMVAAFLTTATAVWRAMLGGYRAQPQAFAEHGHRTHVVRLILFGLLVGVAYHLANAAGLLDSLGTYYGMVRTMANTFVVVACFLCGLTRAQGLLRGRSFIVAAVAVCLLIALSWSSLLLVSGIVYGLAVALGYVIVAKRVPWLMLAVVLAAVMVLHAGKAEMRAKYWASDAASEELALGRMPGFMAEWVGEGLSAIASGETGQSIVERTSLLQMILLAQTNTPDRVDYLMGGTYALLPAILVPRFIESEKPASQVGMDLLNVRYGVLSAIETETTAIGWGLIAEAYANFGYVGVIGVAVILGGFCAVLALWSRRSTEVVSLANLIAIAAMMGLLSLELDFIQLFSSLLQSFGVTSLFFIVYRTIALR